MSSIPIIDLLAQTGGVSARIGAACNEWGVFYVKNHGIDTGAILSKLYKFFNSEAAAKQKAKPKDGYFGYFQIGGEVTIDKKDWKEGMYYRAEYPNHDKNLDSLLNAANHWPDTRDFPDFKPAVQEYMAATKKLAFQLAQCMADHIGLKRTFFTDKISDEPFQQIGMFRYPKSDSTSIASPWGVGPHSDNGFMTVLLQDSVGGFQVMAKSGQWIDVPPIDGTLVVNLCDVAEVWTSGYCHSVMHRVAKPVSNDRYSVAVFIDPCLECVIVPDEAKGSTDCEVSERLKELASLPFQYIDYLEKLYKKSITPNTATQ